jgi:hypothetical protein
MNSDHFTGFVFGLGATALGIYFYKKNKQQVDDWLRQQGINLPQSEGESSATMSMEELVREKERLEDLIAERELAAREPTASGV